MLHSAEEETDVFFDSTDYLSREEPIVAKEQLEFGRLDYQIWLNTPQSVKERRGIFLQKMGLSELAPKNMIDKLPPQMVSERIEECNVSVSTCLASSVTGAGENLVFIGRELNCEANSMVDDEVDREVIEQDITFEGDRSLSHESEAQSHFEEYGNVNYKKMKKSWWKRLVGRKERKGGKCGLEVSKRTSQMSRVKVQQNKKSCMEFTGLYMGQEIQAHKGFIQALKFSPDGQYLASAGEDGVVRVWRVTSKDTSCQSFTDEGEFGNNVNDRKLGIGGKKSSKASVMVPGNVFHIDETPVQEFHGHTSHILDLAWSNSNGLLSSSMDKTVRLWQLDCNHCQNVFPHNDYVTCIQFNPVDENYFISGSIDGKARIWGVSEKRVVSWADARDVISAICYQPDGKGFVVGSITGSCRFYEASGSDVQLEARINIQGRKKTSGSKITGIQFCRDNPQRVMIASDDSKLRIFDGVEIVHKFKGLTKSRSQMSASFTSSGKHIISVGEDCRVYVWNYDNVNVSSSKHAKSVRSCEHFFYEGVSVAVPWSGMTVENRGLSGRSLQPCTQTQDNGEPECFSLGRWFSLDGQCRGSATWPEEKLPLWDLTTAEEQSYQDNNQNHHNQHQNQLRYSNPCTAPSDSWGLVVVTAGWDGAIRTFHNYGLPIRV